VGLGGWAYKNWSESIATKGEVREKVRKLDVEIGSRLYRYTENATASSKELEKMVAELTQGPNATLIFPVFKDRGLISLLWDLESMMPTEDEKKNVRVAHSMIRWSTQAKAINSPTELRDLAEAVVTLREQWIAERLGPAQLVEQAKVLQKPIDNVFASGTSSEKLPPTIVNTKPAPATSTLQAEPKWAYLGEYSKNDKKWRTRYFDFEDTDPPHSLKSNIPRSVRKITGSLNVRSDMPTPDGRFPEVVDILKVGSQVSILAVKSWQETGYMWAQISYIAQ
jgi:hypothetical protein